jgi:hypothetical protein
MRRREEQMEQVVGCVLQAIREISDRLERLLEELEAILPDEEIEYVSFWEEDEEFPPDEEED